MRANRQTYKNVARHCSAYATKEQNNGTYTDRAGDTDVSCTTCRHFTNDAYCALDLFDPIAEKHNF